MEKNEFTKGVRHVANWLIAKGSATSLVDKSISRGVSEADPRVDTEGVIKEELANLIEIRLLEAFQAVFPRWTTCPSFDQLALTDLKDEGDLFAPFLYETFGLGALANDVAKILLEHHDAFKESV